MLRDYAFFILSIGISYKQNACRSREDSSSLKLLMVCLIEFTFVTEIEVRIYTNKKRILQHRIKHTIKIKENLSLVLYATNLGKGKMFKTTRQVFQRGAGNSTPFCGLWFPPPQFYRTAFAMESTSISFGNQFSSIL